MLPNALLSKPAPAANAHTCENFVVLFDKVRANAILDARFCDDGRKDNMKTIFCFATVEHRSLTVSPDFTVTTDG